VQTQAVPAIQADPDRLAQVFTNLLDNAVKHSPAGSEILAAAQVVSEPPARHGQATRSFAQVTVTDSGPGIPPDDLSRIFERFYQVDKSRVAGQGGAGLGLAIAKEIVEAHDGSIIAQSQLGEGAKFIVLLPIMTKRR
jgi:signal transduction histidine kinase